MVRPNQPTIVGRGLGGELRDLRQTARLTVRAVAERLGWQASKLSRMETGHQGIKVEDVAVEHARLRGRGVAVSELHDQPWGQRDFSFEDPDGYTWWYGQPTISLATAAVPASSSQALAMMLREALASNTIGGRAGEGDN